MALGGSLPQINLGVQGVTQRREDTRKKRGPGKEEKRRPERRGRGKKDKRVRERERTEGGGKTKKRERRRKETERESGRVRVKPDLNGGKGLSPEIGVKKTMNAGGVE
ncbi:hypothetical protein TNCV_1324951 [Trichonephila clavipes]|nr:hypothetical protein TNCV_1324951 [Trichonephila clavipes]